MAPCNIHIFIKSTDGELNLTFPNIKPHNAFLALKIFFCELNKDEIEAKRLNLFTELSSLLSLDNIRWQPPDMREGTEAHKPRIECSLDMFDQVVEKINRDKSEVTSEEALTEDYSQSNDDVSSQHEPIVLVKKKSSISSISKVNLNDYVFPRTKDRECSICFKIYPSGIRLRAHFLKHSHEETRYQFCKYCNIWLDSDLEFHLHISQHKLKYCSFCKVSFPSTSSLESHSCVRPYPCTVCDKAFRKKQHLESHSFIHDKIKQYSCETCGKLFRQRNHLRKHREEVHEADPSKRDCVCNQCGKGFATQRRLDYHRNHTHTYKPKTKLKCHICSKEFSRGKLKPHMMRVHENQFPFTCGTCGKGFVSKYYLQRHIKQSHEPKNA